MGSKEIGQYFFGSDLEPFLKSSLSLAALQPEGKVDNLINKLQI